MPETTENKPKTYPWSYSRVSCFSECMLKYRLNYVEGWKSNAPVNTQLADKGSAFHTAAERYFTGMSKEDFVKLLNEKCIAYHVNTTDPIKDFYYDYASAIDKFLAFWAMFVAPLEAQGYKVSQEQKVNNVINGEEFTGSLDLCIENDEKVIVYDYKTGSSVNANNYKRQQVLYAYMKGLEKGWTVEETAQRTKLYIFGPLIPDLEKKTVEQNMLRGVKEIVFTPEEMVDIINNFYKANIDAIHTMNWDRAAGKKKDFHACSWCPYLGSKPDEKTGFCGCKVTSDLGFATPEGIEYHSKKLGK